MSDPPAEFMLRVERDRLHHELAEARREIERLQGLLRLAEAAMYEEYRLRMEQAKARREATAPAAPAAPRS
jgi:hypothetical protein